MGVRSTNPTQSFFDDFIRSGTEASGIVRATGGAISFSSGKTIHSFTSSGSFNVDVGPLSVEYLVVAGGGGGAGYGADNIAGSGGGAGGYRTNASYTFNPGLYSIQVGGGGGGSTDGTPSFIDSPAISSITSTGGGGGQMTNGRTGGSGSGAGAAQSGGTTFSAGSGNTPPTSPPQGHPG